MDVNDVGSYYTTDGEDIWRLVAYCQEPTATRKTSRQTREWVAP